MRDIVRTIDLDSDTIKELCASDSRLSQLINHYGSLQYSLHTDTFSFFVETIIGQMLSNRAADVITERLRKICDNKLVVNKLIELDISRLREIGISKQKSDYIIGFANLMSENPNLFQKFSDMQDDEVIKQLTTIRGIGNWTAKMYLIFVLDRKDILPFEDGAFLQSYKWLYATDDVTPASIKKRCASWSPYSSIAARYLYRALDEGFLTDVNLNKQFEDI